MAKIYFKKITSGDINTATGLAWLVDDVPERWRAEVRELLDASGYNANTEPGEQETPADTEENEPYPEDEPENTEIE